MTRLVMASHVKSPFCTTTISFRKRRRQTDFRTAMILFSLAILCFTAWTPYAIVSLIGQFGPVDDEDGRFELSPMDTSIPAFLAKRPSFSIRFSTDFLIRNSVRPSVRFCSKTVSWKAAPTFVINGQQLIIRWTLTLDRRWWWSLPDCVTLLRQNIRNTGAHRWVQIRRPFHGLETNQKMNHRSTIIQPMTFHHLLRHIIPDWVIQQMLKWLEPTFGVNRNEVFYNK